MPSTRSLLQQLEFDAAGWQIDGVRGLRWILNECHRYMMCGDAWQHIYVDPSTGQPLTITTTDSDTSGTRQYTAPDDCRRIYDVCIDAQSNLASSVYSNYYNSLRTTYPPHQYTFIFGGHQYIRIYVTTFDTLRYANCRYIFPFNPGNTTDTFYLFYYVRPTEILSDSIELDLAEQYHDILADGVLARIGKKSYGDTNAWEYWKKEIVPNQYWRINNDAFQIKTNYVPQRVA